MPSSEFLSTSPSSLLHHDLVWFHVVTGKFSAAGDTLRLATWPQCWEFALRLRDSGWSKFDRRTERIAKLTTKSVMLKVEAKKGKKSEESADALLPQKLNICGTHEETTAAR